MGLQAALRFFTLRPKTGQKMAKYFIQGKGEIRLGSSDFKAQGGEGAVYVRGSTAYKLYSDPRRMIPAGKVAELSVLDHPAIIRPLDLILDAKNKPVGYSMRHVADAYALCQLFPTAFRARTGLTPEKVLGLVRRLREGVRHVHSKGLLVVDLNELNFLVAEDFSEVFFIDVDSYQTPSFPATALMESVRDRHARVFSADSDWFSFAVVSFQMFVGIHPYKGTYPPMQSLPDKERKLDARMHANVSVLHNGVSVPASCLPFDVIPPTYLDWYKAVFEEGRRLPPPDGEHAQLAVAAPTGQRLCGSDNFEITELREFDGEVIWHDGLITITSRSIYFDGKRFPKPAPDAVAGVTPRMRHLVAAYRSGARVIFRDLTSGRELAPEVEGEEVVAHGGRFYVRQRENLFEVEVGEFTAGSLLSVRVVGNVMMKSARLYEGVAIQSLLGAYYASVLRPPGTCHQVRLRELDGYRIQDARLEGRVLVVIGAKEGRYDRLVFRFAEDFADCDVRVARDVASTSINFAVLDGGVVLLLNDEDELEVFSEDKGSVRLSLIADPSVRGDVRLFRTGRRALFARAGKLYRLSLRRPSS